jgi:hypothetical protein
MQGRLSSLLTPAVGLKRWLAVIFAGLLLLALGVAYFLTYLYHQLPFPTFFYWLTLQWIPQWLRGLLFVLGGGALVWLGWHNLSQSLVSILAPELASHTLTQIIRERTRVTLGRPVIVLGSGTGIVPVVHALQASPVPIYPRVILSPTESARITTLLRNDRRLASNQMILATQDEASVWAELGDQTLLEGPNAIIDNRSGLPIRSLFLSRNLRRMKVWEDLRDALSAETLRSYSPDVNPEALALIRSAHMIVIAPGRLFVDVLPILSLPDIVDACHASGAPIVFVANLMTEPGRLSRFSVGEYLATIRQQTGLRIDYVVVNEHPISEELLVKYHAEGSDAIRLRSDMTAAVSKLTFADTGEQTTILEGAILVKADLLSEAPQQIVQRLPEGEVIRELPVARHDPDRLGPVLASLLRSPS